jgi:hypothetical protein
MIDGKQRLLSIVLFMQNRFCTVDKRYFSEDPTGRQRTLMESERETFQRIFIPCAVHRNMTVDQELATFHDLQKGVALTPGEQLHARREKLVVFIKELLDRYPRVFVPKVKKLRHPHLAHALQMAVGISEKGKFILSEKALSVWLFEFGNNVSDDLKKALTLVFERMQSLADICPHTYDRLRPAELVTLGYVLTKKEMAGVPQGRLCDVIGEIHRGFEPTNAASRANFVRESAPEVPRGMSTMTLRALLKHWQQRCKLELGV